MRESRDRGPALTDAERRNVIKPNFAETIQSTRASATTDAFVRQMPRRWRTGDVYAPRDLSPVEMRKWRRPSAPKTDVVDMLGFSPVDNYRVCFPLGCNFFFFPLEKGIDMKKT